MNRNQFGLAAIVLFLSLVAATVYAAPGYGGRGSGGWGMGGSYQRLYNPATVETVTGEVIAVEKFTPVKGMRVGIHIRLKTDRETIAVHLGPSWFMERLEAKIETGDKLEVRGSRVTMGGKPAIIAAEVKKGDMILKLRDDSGIPVWAGWRR